MKITLCSSAKFFDKLYRIKEELEKHGYEVFLPSMQDFHSLESTVLSKIQHDLIRGHFAKIDKSDAIYVANYDKNGVMGYIGGNVLLEMGKAFDKQIPIFLMQNVPKQLSYMEELFALQPIVIGENWGVLDQHLKNRPKQKSY